VALYDTLGRTYSATRRADPRVTAQIGQALAHSASVVNIGAGTGSYEPSQTIAAIEPSQITVERVADWRPGPRVRCVQCERR
jgi:hypothetical protein